MCKVLRCLLLLFRHGGGGALTGVAYRNNVQTCRLCRNIDCSIELRQILLEYGAPEILGNCNSTRGRRLLYRKYCL